MKRTATYILIISSIALVISGCSGTKDAAKPEAPRATPVTQGQIVNLANANSAEDEYAPLLSAAGDELYFTSNRKYGSGSEKIDPGVQYGERLYVSAMTGTAMSDPRIVNPAGFVPNTGMGAWGSGSAELFLGSSYNSSGPGGTDIVSSTLASGAWTSPLPVPNINSPWWDSQPTISPDGGMLVFVSDRSSDSPTPDVHGTRQTDLYFARKNADGSWSQPVMLPAPVNSDANELSPRFTCDGYLYFASLRNPARGYDIYRTKLLPDGSWENAEALPEPINSQYNDCFPMISCDKCTFLFSSDRPGGKGGYDLWAIAGYQRVNLAGGVQLREGDGSLIPGREIAVQIFEGDMQTPFLSLTTDAEGKFSAGLRSCTPYRIVAGTPECFKEANPFTIRPVASKALDTTVTAQLVVERKSAPNIDTYRDRVPYFVTGYWYPNTANNSKRMKERIANQELKDAKFIRTDDYKYDEVIPVIEKRFEGIYTTLEEYLRLMHDRCSTRKNPIEITILGYVDTLGLAWGKYPDETVETHDVKIDDGRVLRGAVIEKDEILLKQPGNVKLSHLRSYFTYTEIDAEMTKRSELYQQYLKAGMIKWKYCGDFVPRENRKNAGDPESRKFEISIR